jgi:hypothetical protein
MAGEGLNTNFQRPRQETIVSVQEDNKSPTALAQTRIACGRDPRIRLPHIPHSSVVTIGRHYHLGVVGRAIINDNDLKVLVRLREDAFYRLGCAP